MCVCAAHACGAYRTSPHLMAGARLTRVCRSYDAASLLMAGTWRTHAFGIGVGSLCAEGVPVWQRPKGCALWAGAFALTIVRFKL